MVELKGSPKVSVHTSSSKRTTEARSQQVRTMKNRRGGGGETQKAG